MATPKTYCGNNLQHPKLTSGTHIQGTNLQCFRQGFFCAFNQLPKNDYTGAYNPIDARRIYCGGAAVMPAGYQIMGSPKMCVQSGFGAGLMRRAQIGYDKIKIAIHAMIIIIMAVSLFISFFKLKPTIVTDSKRNIDWEKFVLLYIILLACLIAVRYWVYFRFYI